MKFAPKHDDSQAGEDAARLQGLYEHAGSEGNPNGGVPAHRKDRLFRFLEKLKLEHLEAALRTQLGACFVDDLEALEEADLATLGFRKLEVARLRSELAKRKQREAVEGKYREEVRSVHVQRL